MLPLDSYQVMMPLWDLYGFGVPQWVFHGSPMDLRWDSDGFGVLPWDSHGFIVLLYGTLMGLRWDSHRFSTGLPRVFHGTPMGFS